MRASSRFTLHFDNPSLNFIGIVYHFSIALLPILYIYNFPIINISVGTIILLLFIPFSFYYYFKKNRKNKKISLIFFLLFYIYIIVRGNRDIKNIIVPVAAFINLLGIVHGSLQSSYFRKIIESVAIFSFGVVFVQTLLHYRLNLNLSFVCFPLLQSTYRENYTGVVYRSVLYRPTGIFLEPAHYSEYCLFALISTLFPEDGRVNMKRAIIIALGIVMTTSGMGILFSGIIFCWFLLTNPEKLTMKLKSVIRYGIILSVFLLILSRFSFFNNALNRVFSADDQGYNAVKGRTGHWEEAIRTLRGNALFWGYGGQKDFGEYLTTLPDTIYRYGLIGLFLQLLIFIYMMFKRINNYVWCSTVVFLGLFCAAHLTSTCLQLFYYTIIFLEVIRPKRELKHLKLNYFLTLQRWKSN